MSKPVLSVIMAAKNREKIIGESIESYLKQDFQQFELIIIDDHSEDNTLKIAQSYQKQNKNIKIFSLPANLTGVSSARDYGIKKMSSEIIVIGDSDDISEKNRLAIIAKTFNENPTCQCFYSNCKLLYQENNKIVVRPFQPFDKKLLKSVNFITNSSSAFRKLAYEQSGGYDKHLILGEDYDLWLTFLDYNYNFMYSDKTLVVIRIHDNSIRSNERNRAKLFIKKVREKHRLPTPNIKETKKITDSKYWKYLSTPGGLDLWFN